MRSQWWETQFRKACAGLAALLAQVSVFLVMVLPKEGSDAAVSLVVAVLLASAVFGAAVALVRGEYVGAAWTRRTGRWWYILVGVFIVLGIVAAVMAAGGQEPILAYYPAFSGLYVTQMFVNNKLPGLQPKGGHGNFPGRWLTVWTVTVFLAGVGATVGMVFAAQFRSTALSISLIVLTIILWMTLFLATLRLDGWRRWRRERVPDVVPHPWD